MQINEPAEEDSSGSEPAYSEHREPEEQGGNRYVRCEGCDRELLEVLGGRENLAHRDGCPVAEADACECCGSPLVDGQFYAEIEYPPEVDGEGWFSGSFCRGCVLDLEETIRGVVGGRR